MFLYVVTNNVNGHNYYGITKNCADRWNAHRRAVRKGAKSKFYCAIRSYGIENFTWECVVEGEEQFIRQLEVDLIASDPDCYNMHPGGYGGFSVLSMSDEEIEAWRAKLRAARAGRKPALGMKQTDEVKATLVAMNKRRATYTNIEEILSFGCAEARRKFGISKTHYHRLRKAATGDTQS